MISRYLTGIFHYSLLLLKSNTNSDMSKIKGFLFGEGPVFLGELGWTIFRITIGLSLAVSHGLGKMPPPDGLVQAVENIGFPFPLVFAWCAGLSEFAGGLLLAAGFLSRPAALTILITMCVAILGVHSGDPYGKWELAVLYAVATLPFITRGSGKFSVDTFFKR